MDLETIKTQLQENGFAVIRDFLSSEEVKDLKAATDEIIEEYCQDAPISVFGNQSRDHYFAESGDKIRGFYEEGVLDKEGRRKLTGRNGLNKVGHALHKFHPGFRAVTFGSKVKQVLREVTSMKDPVANQSMVIFKHPRVGGKVIPHQDATYLFTEPTPGTLLGFWIALDEASSENGCLYFVPGSHKPQKVFQRFIRNPDQSSETLFIHNGESVPQPSNECLKAAECRPGDLVLIDGLVIHHSAANASEKPRMAYTFHVYDGNAKYSEENWLQPTEQGTFEKYNTVSV